MKLLGALFDLFVLCIVVYGVWYFNDKMKASTTDIDTLKNGFQMIASVIYTGIVVIVLRMDYLFKKDK